MYSPSGTARFRTLLERDSLLRLSLMVISLPCLVIAWWLFAGYLYSQGIQTLPYPDAVLTALIQSAVSEDPGTNNSLWQNIAASLGRFGAGFFIGLLSAVPIGLLIGYSKTMEAFAKPIVEVLRPIPPIAWVIFLLLTFGLFWGPVLTIFIGVFFPVLSNVIFGVRRVDPILIDAAKTQGAGGQQIFTKVIFPFCIPFIMAGVRIGLGIGWMCIVAAEFVAAQGGGVGVMITASQNVGRPDFMFAGMITIAVLGIVTLGASQFIERRVNRWMGMD